MYRLHCQRFECFLRDNVNNNNNEQLLLKALPVVRIAVLFALYTERGGVGWAGGGEEVYRERYTF